MGSLVDITGERFTRLVAIVRVGAKHGQAVWRCQCDCGNVVEVLSANLRKGNSKSCGCLNIEAIVSRSRTHGESLSRTYSIWRNVVNRCINKNCKSYLSYGAAGVDLCKEWLSFERFFSDMGHPPSRSHSIDRIDGLKGYSKDNCRWATPIEQSRNRSNLKKLTMNGITRLIPEWAEVTGIESSVIRQRINNHGWSTERALTEPVRKRRG